MRGWPHSNTVLVKVGLWVVALLLLLLGAPVLGQTEEAPGREVFLAKKCNLCHAIESEGIEKRSKSDSAATQGSDLSTVGDRHDAEWLKGFLNKEIELDGETHKKGFRGTDEELAALIGWLVSLKTEGETEAAANSEEP